MRTIHLSILSTLLLLAIAIPATASCSSCFTDVYVSPDAPTQQIGAQCQLNSVGDIPDCRVVTIGGIPQCTSGQNVGSCGEIITCPPWECPTIVIAGAPKQRSVIRPVLLGL